MILGARLPAWIGLGAALLAGGFVLAFERVGTEVTLPPRGPAAINPLHALERTLAARGVPVRSVPNLNFAELRPGPTDTIVLRVPPDALREGEAEAIYAWIEGGGQLVMAAPAAESPAPLQRGLGIEPLGEPPAAGGDAGDDEAATPMDEDAESPAPRCQRVRAASGGQETFLCGPRFSATKGWTVLARDADGLRYVRGSLGEGMITVGDLGVLENAALKRPAAREIAELLLAPHLGDGKVHLVYATRIAPWHVLLVRAAWPVLVPLLLALLAWTLWRSQRIGPLAGTTPAPRRALLEHIRASGELAFRRGHAEALHRAVAALVERRLQQRRPVLAALEGEARVLALADALGMDPARVRHAFLPVALQRPGSFLHSLSALIDVRNRL